jgi:hypothetical protein
MNNGGGNEVGTWNFSGVVVDGASDKILPHVEIAYTDQDGNFKNTQTDEQGKFYISNLPYGERTFVFTCTDSTRYTTKRVVEASYSEASSLGGVIGDISRIVRLYPLTAAVSGSLVYQPKGTDYQLPAVSATLKLYYSDSTMKNAEPAVFTTTADSQGHFEMTGLPLAPGGIISFSNFKKKEITYQLPAKSLTVLNSKTVEDLGKLVFTTTDSTGWTATKFVSNILSNDGEGITGVPVNGTIWYKLPVALKPGSVSATVNGAGTPGIVSRMASDTLFLIPVSQLMYDTLMEVKISGYTNDQENFSVTLGGKARFRTQKSPFPVEANFWSQPWIMTGRFGIGQTLWVRYSEMLDTMLNTYNWTSSSAAATIYGSGALVNAKVRISKDTLFIVPDQRLKITYNSTIGFKVQARTVDGRYCQFFDFGINTIEDPLFMVWTNTKDAMGNNRIDMGLRDTVKVVSSVTNFTVVGVSEGKTELAPPGLILSDVSVSGDTIVFVPSLSLRSDTAYSIDFDLQFSDGTVRKDVLGVSWSTKKKMAIIASDTKKNGMYRPMDAYGDSFSVTFSEPIDTGINAAVAFRVNIKDVNGVRKRSSVRWDRDCRVAMIKLLDTLPTADYDAPAAYTATATLTKAVESVTFDLVTRSGEQVLGCKPQGDPIALHTEKGMCIIATNIVPNIDSRTSVEKEFTPDNEFPLNGIVELQFSRTIDTSLMKMDSLKLYAGIHKPGAVIVPSTVTILSDLKTIQIKPADSLEMKTSYYVWIKGVPAVNIAGAAPIKKHGGTFSGTSGASYLLDRPFKTQ